MPFDPQRHKRQSIRLRDYRYNTAAGYAVTICTHQKQMIFGRITSGVMELSEAGELVKEEWLNLSVRYPSVLLDHFVVMPNHLHGIIFLSAHDQKESPTPILGTVVGAFKSLSSRAVGKQSGDNSCRIWQRNYYEQIIRSEAMRDAFRQYIDDNPYHWQDDAENNIPFL